MNAQVIGISNTPNWLYRVARDFGDTPHRHAVFSDGMVPACPPTRVSSQISAQWRVCFPPFGHASPNGGWDYSFSYANFALIPVMLNGRLDLAAVAPNGVGWHERTNVLFAVYALLVLTSMISCRSQAC